MSSEVRVTDPHTGGQKGQKEERYDLLPYEALDEVARVYSFGAKKYANDNWLKGYSWRLSLGALLRHVARFAAREDRDPESGLHHLAHAVFHCLALITFGQRAGGTDDRMAAKEEDPARATDDRMTAKEEDPARATDEDTPRAGDKVLAIYEHKGATPYTVAHTEICDGGLKVHFSSAYNPRLWDWSENLVVVKRANCTDEDPPRAGDEILGIFEHKGAIPYKVAYTEICDGRLKVYSLGRDTAFNKNWSNEVVVVKRAGAVQ